MDCYICTASVIARLNGIVAVALFINEMRFVVCPNVIVTFAGVDCNVGAVPVMNIIVAGARVYADVGAVPFVVNGIIACARADCDVRGVVHDTIDFRAARYRYVRAVVFYDV